MRISMLVSYAGGFKEAVKEVQTLEKAGLDLVWVPEAYRDDDR
jgi:alkanesulfonate monooxygenase SsuD/methylene tetrahydromethanopterin reductase-like flavin-dependent oxidoreductase (luciferase family)